MCFNGNNLLRLFIMLYYSHVWSSRDYQFLQALWLFMPIQFIFLSTVMIIM